MSFKLSELLNPAPTSSEPRPSQSSSQSPPAPGASPHTHDEHMRGGSEHHAHAVTSSYEAASALTALATSGGSSAPQYPTAQPHHSSHVLPSLPWPSPSPASARRASHTLLPAFSDRALNVMPDSATSFPQNHTTLPPLSPTHGSSLEHYRSSRSPDELRRGSFATFEPSLSFNANANAPSPGPVLAPLYSQALGSAPPAPHDQGTGKGDSIPKNASGSLVRDLATDNPSHSATISTPVKNEAKLSPVREIEVSAKMEEDTDSGTVEGASASGMGAEPTQIREPSAAAPEAMMTPQAPEPAERKPLDANEAEKEMSPPKIKHEDTATPREGTPVSTLRRGSTQVHDENMDEDTLRAIEAAKSDFGRKASRVKPSIEELSPAAAADEGAAAAKSTSKKRPAPKVKKGQAAKKPPSKKRKVDNVNDGASDRLSPARANKLSRPSGGKKSKSNTPALGSSPAPGSVVSGASSAYGSESEGSDDENEAYCICRRGDNHTWMIACDGGCEDWFHGKCVDILEDDGELIDKYICPNCAETSGKVTTWLPGCRNRSCRRPARIRRGDMSKYCSDRCGREFMEEELRRSEMARKEANGKGTRDKPKRRGITMSEISGAGEGDSDDDLGPRGGALKASELKALVTSANGDVSAFRDLGRGIMSPPATVSPTAERFPSDPASATETPLTSSEKTRVDAISAEKDNLRRRRALLRDREKFGQLIRENVARYAEREKVKPKDVCGYDNRLTWSEEEFKLWRDSEDGRATLEAGVLEIPEAKDGPKPEVNGHKEDEMDVDQEEAEVETKKEEGKKPTMCAKKRCERHRNWQKQALSDVRFEEASLADSMRSLDQEEKEIKEMAALRGRMEKGGLGGEGSVEVVGEA